MAPKPDGAAKMRKGWAGSPAQVIGHARELRDTHFNPDFHQKQEGLPRKGLWTPVVVQWMRTRLPMHRTFAPWPGRIPRAAEHAAQSRGHSHCPVH